MTPASRATAEIVPPERIGGRYSVAALLGRGGMAHVYRVVDTNTGREIALKQLLMPSDTTLRAEVCALFEREFHTLAQLSHPRVIEVYDYGVDQAGPYYTMELLDGGDLRERAPLPWREACSLIFDVCSSLALLHSRRLVHRDVSPRNVRCTRDGLAKLIDFGAMVPMGPGGQIVGTPAFVAPEVVHRSHMDARTDLFSLGATLYYALTRRMPYAAREFRELDAAWAEKPAPPSAYVADVPHELDVLVASLLSVEPALRPRSAFDVMQRLAAIADLQHDEPLSVAQAYLSTPQMVGRDRIFAVLRRRLARALRGHGRGVLIEGRRGLGRSRMLDAYMLEAKTLGATVLRVSVGATGGASFSAAQALAEQLVLALPGPAWTAAEAEGTTATLLRGDPQSGLTLARLAGPKPAGLQTQVALSRWLLRISKRQPIAIAVDDVHRIDEPSAALLAALADNASGHRLLLALTSESGATRSSQSGLAVLATRCVRWRLAPLTRAQTGELLGSVFGDVANIGPLCSGIHAIAAGNPRDCLDIAQHLVDKGLIRYEQGGWTLPAELDLSDLPSSAEDAIRARIIAFGSLARTLAEFHTLSLHGAFGRQDYALLLPDVSSAAIDEALMQLLSSGALTSDGRVYALAHRGWAAALLAALSNDAIRACHRALAEFHRPTAPLQAVGHLLEGGLYEPALDLMAQAMAGIRDHEELAAAAHAEPAQLVPMFDRVITAAIAHRRAPREVHELRRWLCSLTIVSDSRYFDAVAPAWLAQLEADSGLTFWREQESALVDANTRLMTALMRAQERFNGTRESERVYPPEEAIKHLVQYVAIGIVVGSWTLNGKLLRSLPGLLAPFAKLSLALEAVLQNARATIATVCDLQPELARRLWSEVFEKLRAVSPSEMPYVDLIRSAVAYGVGSLEARLGLPSAARWVDFLDADPLQSVNGLYLRRTMQLQQGDWDEAERFRRQAEVLALQSGSRQMFNLAPLLELAAHSFAGNLGGLKETAARIEVHAQTHAGWAPYRELAEALFQRQRGDIEAACAAFERALSLAAPDAGDPERHLLAWPTTLAGYIETLVALGRAEEARVRGEHALAIFRERNVDALAAHDVVRALALAEAKLGNHAAAIARIEGLITEHTELALSGLHLGASYEARARIAIWMADAGAFAAYAPLAAREYRHAQGSPLGVRYERLIEEARLANVCNLPQSIRPPSDAFQRAVERTRAERSLAVETKALREANDPPQRATRALKLLCAAHAAQAGHLFLFSDNALAHVASQGERMAPEGLGDYLTDYLTRDHEDVRSTTAIMTDPSRGQSKTEQTWTSTQGRVYHPVVLACVVEGVERYAGLVALAFDNRRDYKPGQLHVAASIAGLLIAAGDTTGIAVDELTSLRSQPSR